MPKAPDKDDSKIYPVQWFEAGEASGKIKPNFNESLLPVKWPLVTLGLVLVLIVVFLTP